MALTAAELSNISNAALDFYVNRGNVMSQSIQDKPLFAAMDKAAKFVNENPTQAKEAMKKYLHESQQEYVQFYPDASYQLTAETSDKEFQDVANQYLEIGIIPSKIQVGGLIK